MVKLHDLHFTPYLSASQIAEAVQSLAQKVAQDYHGKTPVFLGVLNGAYRFTAALTEAYTGNCEVEFVKLASYAGTASTGTVSELIGVKNLKGKSVIIVEDIVDTGKTLSKLIQLVQAEQVADYSIATLFYKPEAYQEQHPLTYVGLEIPDKFIVGYGLDYDGLGRNLSEVYQLKDS